MPYAPPWTNQDLRLYHGTTRSAARNIVDFGVDVHRSPREDYDFGRGFYCTTLREQAAIWAEKKSLRAGEPPALVAFIVPRSEMADLDSLAFFSANKADQDFWSFVYFCRNFGLNHGRTVRYDIVCGPLVSWAAEKVTENGDQISFHTIPAQQMLNLPGRRSIVELW